ncbi:hypothetical protein [Oscillatoria sp. FACHB-1406]
MEEILSLDHSSRRIWVLEINKLRDNSVGA